MQVTFGARAALPAQYAITIVLVAVCFLLRWELPWHGFSFFLFVPAVLLGAALFGKGPAIFAVALTVAVATFFWLDPIYSFWITPHQVPPLALYILLCIGIVGLCEWTRAGLQRRMSGAAAGAPASNRPRFEGLDFWRGFVLCTIFADHIPGNIFENFTYRNFGFSDAAEAFVFLSGVSLALAYSRKFSGGRRLVVVFALLRRALKLYCVHIALSLAAIAIFAAGSLVWRAPELLTEHGRDLFVADAGLCLTGIVSLGHQLGYFNILPLYIVLITLVPVYLWLAGFDRRLMLATSAVIYAGARLFAWDLPSWPIPGGWFFNPLTWQLMMAIGIAVGIELARGGTIARSTACAIGAAAVVLLGLLVATDGFGGALGGWGRVRGWLDLDKTSLGLFRLVHFLALAYLVEASGVTRRLRASVLFSPLSVLGRHSLLVFSLLSLFAAAGQVLVVTVRTTAWFDLPLVGGGIILLVCAARLAEAGSLFQQPLVGSAIHGRA